MTRYFLPFLVLFCESVTAQKYNFVNWTVEDGLVQSQASCVGQDNFRQLWIGTEGGLSCFDGKRFRSFTVQDGLPANHVSCVLSTPDSMLWIGTSAGLVRFNGSRFYEQDFDGTTRASIRAVAQAAGGLYTLANLRLYRLRGRTAERITVSGDTSEKISAIFSTRQSGVIACVYGKGIYTSSGDGWKMAAEQDAAIGGHVVFNCLVRANGDTVLAASNGLHLVENGRARPYLAGGEPVKGLVLCAAEDASGNLWVGTDRGAMKVTQDAVMRFTGQNGLTDNTVNHIYSDAEGNLWFATNADGIFKFRENTFTYYDKSAGLHNPIVMGIGQTSDGRVYMAGYGGGVYYTDGGRLIQAPGTEMLGDSRVNCLYVDRNDRLWIGTLNKGIYCYDPSKKKITNMSAGNLLPHGATVFCEDHAGNLFIGSGQGLFVLPANGKPQAPAPETGVVSALARFDRHHLLMGTAHGLYLIDTLFNTTPFLDRIFGKSSVMCVARQGNRLFVGTSDKGIYMANLTTGRATAYNTRNGLPNNFIYSVDASEPNRLWAGTGFGISRMELDSTGQIVSVKNYGRADGLLGMECNHNSLLRDRDGGLWFGTTKGLFRFNPGASRDPGARPLVVLRSVKLFSSPIQHDDAEMKSEGTWFSVPGDLRLSHRQNHLSFELAALYFTNPDDIQFRYTLQGIDKGYTTTNNPLIIYPALPPGNYVLRVKALTKSGMASENEVLYSFEIRKAFYQTTPFRVIGIVLLVGSGALVAYLITRARHRRRQREKEMLARIREEEFARLRQRTAEDFHDEMGNSLTRISVLTDVLKVKLNGDGKEVAHLVQQIKDNTTALYHGSRDIIWSLNSRHDALYEIAEHLRDIGTEIFQDTSVEFRCSHNVQPGSALRLKLDYSRNLTMVFKEAYTNVLKHANASRVEVKIELRDDRALEVSVADNGGGFSRGNGAGNGLRNMENRVQRMQGLFVVNSGAGQGTEIRIRLDDVFVN